MTHVQPPLASTGKSVYKGSVSLWQSCIHDVLPCIHTDGSSSSADSSPCRVPEKRKHMSSVANRAKKAAAGKRAQLDRSVAQPSARGRGVRRGRGRGRGGKGEGVPTQPRLSASSSSSSDGEFDSIVKDIEM